MFTQGKSIRSNQSDNIAPVSKRTRTVNVKSKERITFKKPNKKRK